MQVLLSTLIAALSMYDQVPEFGGANAYLNVVLERDGDLPLDLDVDFEDNEFPEPGELNPQIGDSWDMTGTVGEDGVIIEDEKDGGDGVDPVDPEPDAAEEGLEVPDPLPDDEAPETA